MLDEKLEIIPEKDHIPVCNGVIPPLDPDEAFFAGGRIRTVSQQFFHPDYFRFNKPTGKIGMNLPGGFHCLGPFLH
jgi:hypothetical protein